MKNPYLITEPVCISFSGGRSSAFMLYKVLEAHGGQLPDFAKVIFCNTGKEMPQTLQFVNDCSERWGVNIVWLELAGFRKNGIFKSGQKAGKDRISPFYKEVDFKTASRAGKPYEILTDHFQYLPNIINRFCTSFLKIKAMNHYFGSKSGEVTRYVGLRGDEPRRAVKIHGKTVDGHEVYAPLYVNKVTKSDVCLFWKNNDFDLNLPNDNGTTALGNCDLCFLKSQKTLISIIRENPDFAEWWIDQEEKYKSRNGGFQVFRKDSPSYRQSQIIATENNSFDFEALPDNSHIDCFCGD